ncbi:hypothetical protein GCM10011391_16630 [Pullulanibacillus camelliae]|uniref:DUF2663 family protein n=1 Tax=Pullulanibacillus camelliae TaxID=1707096 RepID=A0A8J2YGW3_9BACL|nr:DUF2663 family protein [Pullulanibacillus camelliae]GGE38479.1 hypothetical protein GCM10011391_16630 [Pullulanibacillus camelliae]
MDAKLLKLYEEERLSNIAFKLMAKLIERKQMKDRYKLALYIVSIALLMVMGLLLYYLFNEPIYQTEDALSLQMLLQNTAIKHFLFPDLILFVIWRFLSRQYNEKDKDYEKLRLQLIDRANDLWKHHIERDIQGEVYEQLKEIYDINLFYK